MDVALLGSKVPIGYGHEILNKSVMHTCSLLDSKKDIEYAYLYLLYPCTFKLVNWILGISPKHCELGSQEWLLSGDRSNCDLSFLVPSLDIGIKYAA